MTTLLAIIAHDRGDVVAEKEMQDLTAAYERLRGAGRRATACGSEWVRVTTVSHAGHPAGIERSESSWAAWAGSLQHHGPLVEASPEALDGQFVSLHYDSAGEVVTWSPTRWGSSRCSWPSARAGPTSRPRRWCPPGTWERGAARRQTEAFLRTGRQFGPWTSWRGVGRAEPARAVRFDSSGITERTYWVPCVDERMARLSLLETAEACPSRGVEYMRETFGDRENPWCDLTGGFDSRLLALLLDRAGGVPHQHVWDEQSEDVQSAADVSAASGWRWSRFGLPGDWADILPERSSSAVA